MVLVGYNKACVFNQFQSYDNIAEKGCAGGLNGGQLPALTICPIDTRICTVLFKYT